MSLYAIIARIHSWFICRGRHEMVPTNSFILDDDGPDVKMLVGWVVKGRQQYYKVCRKCGLRDDGKGFDP